MTEAPPRLESPARNPIGWIALGLLLLFAVYNLASGFDAKGAASEATRPLEELRSALVSEEMTRGLGPRASVAGLRGIEEKVAPKRKTDAEAAALWVAVRTELKEPTARADLAPALASARVDLRAIAEAYALRPAPKDAAKARATVLDGRGVLSRLAATHLREAAGLPGARAWIEAAVKRYFALLAILAVVGMGSLFAWGALLISAASGSLPNLGPPLVAHNLADADRLALRAAALMAGFQGVSIVFSIFGGPTWVRTVGVGLSMFAVLPLVLRSRPSYEETIRARGFLGRKVLLGLWAFLLEIPVTMIVAGVGSVIFRNLPVNEHPAAKALMNSHDVPTIASLFFLGAVVAPYWEETMFRGLLFPAVRRMLNSPVWGALLSSFVFACIHPQGPGGWLGLMTFALCSCVLVNRTRSLVPSMVMHAAHNATLLTLALLMGG